MALVRVYCGLASADSAVRPASAGPTLTSAVVDDSGRLLHVGEIGDDPEGYARLVTVLVERSGGPSGAAIATDSDDHLVTSLLGTSGRPIALADDDSVDEFAEEFADDESVEEIQAGPAQRRAVGLARALQAGALSAVTLPTPRDLMGYKPVLAAHAALAGGRHAAAGVLREVLRELYPAALRAYADPAAPVALAVLDALPEPGMLAAGNGTGRSIPLAVDAVAAHLAGDGVAPAEVVGEAVTALRIAVAETPRRAGVNRSLTSAVAETIRQAVAAVRACDAGCDALVATLSARMTAPLSPSAPLSTSAPLSPSAALSTSAPLDPSTPSAQRAVLGAGTAALPSRPRDESAPQPSARPEPARTVGRRSRPEPVSAALPGTTAPMSAPPAPTPVSGPPQVPGPRSAPPDLLPSRFDGTPPPAFSPAERSRGENRPVSAPTPMIPTQRGKVPPAEAGEPFRPTLTTAALQSARAERQRAAGTRSAAPVDTEPTTGGFSITDHELQVPPSRRPEPTEAPAAPPGSRANWPLVTPEDDDEAAAPPPVQPRSPEPPAAREAPVERVTPPWLADDLPPEPPVLRLVEAPGERSRRAPEPDAPLRLVDRQDAPREHGPERLDAPRPERDLGRLERLDLTRPERDPARAERLDTPRPERRDTERADTRRPERRDPDRIERRDTIRTEGLDAPRPERGDAPRLERREAPRLERREAPRLERREAPRPEHHDVNRRERLDAHRPERLDEHAERGPAPMGGEEDGDLLIFAAARSAWFTGQPEEEDAEWSSTADTGWRAAEQAARPAIGDSTRAGLPKRVPQANLVPGSPLREERPLRIVRNPQRLAESTTGYFQGWRRGQEIGGFAVGGRPGREAAGGWDFTRDGDERDDEREYEYRSAGYRS